MRGLRYKAYLIVAIAFGVLQMILELTSSWFEVALVLLGLLLLSPVVLIAVDSKTSLLTREGNLDTGHVDESEFGLDDE